MADVVGNCGTCVIEKRGVEENRRALIDGFQIPQFLLVPEESPDFSQTFDWMPPPDVRSVSCGLFRCIPQVGEADSSDVGGKPVRTIVNAERCAAAVATFPFGEGPVALEDMRRTERSRAEASGFPQPTVVTSLTLACLAFDATGPTHGTVLLQLTTEQVASILDDELSECLPQAHDDAVSCEINMPGERQEFGLCFESKCHWRCLDEADCIAGVEAEHPGVLCDPDSRVCVDISDAGMSEGAAEPTLAEGLETFCVRPWGSDVPGVCVSPPRRVEH